jgi:hypothetical protein
MEETSFSGSAQITDEGIKKHFKNLEPVKALYELVWNGLDANANTVEVRIEHNALDGLERILVIDNGEGVDARNTENNFEKFNESSKKLDDDKHGSHGKGRLAFYKLCSSADWYTKRDEYHALISIKSIAIKDFSGIFLDPKKQHIALKSYDSGTCVELQSFSSNKLPDKIELLRLFGKEFGWYLALNKAVELLINGEKVVIPNHDLHKYDFKIDHTEFVAKIIRWDDKPTSEKSYNYLINSKGKVVQKEHSKFNNKVTFHTSAYVSSDWVDGYDQDLLEMDVRKSEQVKMYSAVMKKLLSIQKEIYSDYLRRYVDSEIDRFDKNGYFPSYVDMDKNYADWRKNNTKIILKDLYFAEPTLFSRLNAKQSKIIIRLLDAVLVSNENEALFDVLDGVLELDQDNLSSLSKQLQKTSLENIISTIEILQKRQLAVHQLRELMESRYTEVLEIPDLQKIIENNTWLFGRQYSVLGAEEDTFTSISKTLRDKVKDISVVSDSDIEEGATIEGANRQVDLFLARKIPEYDSRGELIYKCIIVEIKRPSISLNKKHLQQLEDYAEIISKHDAFSSQKMTFDLILIGRKISRDDYQIRKRLEDLRSSGEQGLISDGRIKCFVKDWFTIFDEFDLTNNYLLGTLNTKRDDLSGKHTEDLVGELQNGTS